MFPENLCGKNIPSVLIIEDETDLLRLFKKALTKFGYQVEIAGSGKEGIRKFDKGGFDVVITDLVMPEIDGRLVLQHIRSSPRRCTPVICISGTPWLADSENFDYVIHKPFTIEMLAQTINAFL